MLHGRDRERAAVAALLDAARAGRGGALVVRGLPGTGKSALLADAADRAGGMTVLRTSGVESESPLAFAALQRLLHPALRVADRLPGPQAQALRAALGEVAGNETDRFLAFLGALGVLAEAAERAPVLAVVDDAHWLDDASAAALLFVARRVQDERVALLFAAREGDVRTFDGEDLPALPVGGVDAAAARSLLAERAGVRVPREVGDALVAGTGGNPLALVELGRSLSAEQLGGTAPLPARLPLTQGVERAFLDRYRRLPPAARTVLLVAAADDAGGFATVRAAAAALGADDEGWVAAERSGLLRVRDGRVELRHPLVRSAVYDAVTSTERRRVHRALADALGAAPDADRRAWHLAASVDEPDGAVVAELEQAADRAARRGGHEAAASAWERAAELSRQPDDRARLLYAAARGAWLAARPARARALSDAAVALAAEPGLRADARRLRARVEWNTGSVDVGHGMILEAAAEVAPADPGRAREMAMFATALAAFGARSGSGIDPTALVPDPAPGAPARERCFSALLHGLAAASAGDWPRAVPVLRGALDLADELTDADQDLLPNLGIAALHLGDDEATTRFDERLLARARSTGAVVMVLYTLTRELFTQVATGRWEAARAAVAEALPLAEHTGQPGLRAMPTAVLALLAAVRGEDDAADTLAAAERLAAGYPMGILAGAVTDTIRWARGAAAAASPEAALHHLERIDLPVVRRLAATDRIEAAVAAGRPGTARAWVDELAGFAAATGAPWAAAVAEHGRALLATGSDAEAHFERALACSERSPRTPDRARTRLAYGAHLRRLRRRVDARVHLRAALETFEELGAAHWAERARQELRASGETARRRSAPASADLTPQELQVALLVRQGLSNRDVAARLYLSPRTVDFHLRNAFAKVGVSSRTELAARLAG
ncbi:AAA family ATPase [Geodermatophilus sp. SYSU D00758]